MTAARAGDHVTGVSQNCNLGYRLKHMFDSLTRWLGNRIEPHGWTEQAEWAKSRQATLRPVREFDGFVIEGQTGATIWRLEWGPSQRSYIKGNEMRLRADLAVPRELQVLVLTRSLMDSLERQVFDQYVEGVQTRIDTETPPEMRWLVMFPRLSGGELMEMRERFGALSSFNPWLQQWLSGPLRKALTDLSWPADHPTVLMIARRRLSLRTGMMQPTADSLETALRLFESALFEARRVAVDFTASGAPSTQPSMFSASILPAEAARP